MAGAHLPSLIPKAQNHGIYEGPRRTSACHQYVCLWKKERIQGTEHSVLCKSNHEFCWNGILFCQLPPHPLTHAHLIIFQEMLLKMFNDFWNPILIVVSCDTTHSLRNCVMNSIPNHVVHIRHQTTSNDGNTVIGVVALSAGRVGGACAPPQRWGWQHHAKQQPLGFVLLLRNTNPPGKLNNSCLSFLEYH